MTGESAEPGPPVVVELPDGQKITAHLRERRRKADGSWWFVVTLSLWSEVEQQRVWSATPYETVMSVPAGKCQRVEGQSYEGVATTREQT